MKPIFTLLLSFIGLPIALLSQNLSMRTITALPAVINETSGLIQTAPNRLWSHNDSGGEAKLYQFDTTGTLLRTLVLRGVSNVDWEEITQDSAGNVYVGDFGNNDNLRSDLKIYKIPNPDLIVGDSVNPEVIQFSYPDQFAFPPADSLRYFDMEGMVSKGDSLYLFSKNRTDPFDGITKCYSLPQNAGTYVAVLRDSVVTCASSMPSCWVSAAGLSPNGENLVLLAYGKLWLYSCFNGTDFFGGGILERNISFSQTEAIAWKDATHIYLTDERINGLFGRNLYEIDLGPYLAAPNSFLGADTLVYVGDTILVGVPQQFGASYSWNTGQTSPSIQIAGNNGAGTYILTVTAINGCMSSDTIEVSTAVNLEMPNPNFHLECFPNPFSKEIEISIVGSAGIDFELQILDLSGKVFQIESAQTDINGQYKMSFGEGLAPGFYLLNLSIGDSHKIRKLLKR